MSLPARVARLPDDTSAEVLRRHVRGHSDARIAREIGITRTTVKRAKERTLAAIAVLSPVEAERGKAIAVYREVQRVAWEAVDAAIERGRSPVMLLAEIRLSQQRIDAVLGLEIVKPEVVEIHAFTHVVASLIRQESPDMADRLAQRLLEMRNGANA